MHRGAGRGADADAGRARYTAGDQCRQRGESDLPRKKGKEDSITTKIELSAEVPLPLAAGSKVGTLYVMKDGKEVGAYDLLAEESVDKASFKELILRAIS